LIVSDFMHYVSNSTNMRRAVRTSKRCKNSQMIVYQDLATVYTARPTLAFLLMI